MEVKGNEKRSYIRGAHVLITDKRSDDIGVTNTQSLDNDIVFDRGL